MSFASAKFFLFLVRRNSGNFAPAYPRKLFAAHWLARGSGAKLTEFRLGGVTKTPRREAKFARILKAGTSDVQNSPTYFWTPDAIWVYLICAVRRGEGAQNSWGWVLRIFAFWIQDASVVVVAQRWRGLAAPADG